MVLYGHSPNRDVGQTGCARLFYRNAFSVDGTLVRQ